MGKLTICGESRLQVKADLEKLTISISYGDDNPATVAKKLLEKSETILKEFQKMGISPDKMNLGKNEIDHKYYEKEPAFQGSRVFKVTVPFDMKINNIIMEIIQKHDLSVEIDAEFYISDEKAIRDTLVQEAIEDSRVQAERIAKTMQQKIVGIDTLDLSRDTWHDAPTKVHKIGIPERTSLLADKVGAPVKELYENVEVVWIME